MESRKWGSKQIIERPTLSPHPNPLPEGEGNTLKFAGRWEFALSPTGNAGDAIFRGLMFAAALLILLIVLGVIAALAAKAMLSIQQFGFSFLTSREWNPVSGQFGALPFIYGTVVSSAITTVSVLSLRVTLEMEQEQGSIPIYPGILRFPTVASARARRRNAPCAPRQNA